MKKILIALCFLSSVTCSGHGPSVLFSNQNKPIYESSLCIPGDPLPQMVLIPFFEEASQIMPNCKTYPKHMTALAMMVFYHKWEEYFGDSDYAVRGMLQKVMIQWGTTKKISRKGSGSPAYGNTPIHIRYCKSSFSNFTNLKYCVFKK